MGAGFPFWKGITFLGGGNVIEGKGDWKVELIKNNRSNLADFERLPVKSYTFESYDVENMEIAALLFQTGYLTIKKITGGTGKTAKTYHLSYPNREVRVSFLTHLFGDYTQKDMSFSTRFLERIDEAVAADDMDRFVEGLRSLFASIPYQIFIGEREAYYHSVIYLVLKLTGAVVRPEESTNTGRIDAVMESENKVYIMEFKMGSAKEALAQVKEKKYYEKYLGGPKEVVLMGMGFDPEKRNIGNFLLESV